MRRYSSALALLLLIAGSAAAVEHPGVMPKDAECAGCHASKVTGKFVHSAMGTSCTVCPWDLDTGRPDKHQSLDAEREYLLGLPYGIGDTK